MILHEELDQLTSEWELSDPIDIQCKWPIDSDSIVFEVGGYEGKWSRLITDRYNHPTIHFFEPSPSSFACAREKLADCPNIRMYNCALGHKEGLFWLGDENRDGASFFTDQKPVVAAKMEDIAKVIAQERLGRIDLMQINAEGSEYLIVPRLINTGLISIIDYLMVQWHHVKYKVDMPDMERIWHKLLETHTLIKHWKEFTAWKRKPMVDDAWCTGDIQALIQSWGPLPQPNSYWQPGVRDGDWKSKVQEEVLWDWPDIDENSIIFEVGGYGGAFTEQMIQRYQPHIYFFEPSPRALEFAKQRLGNYPKIAMYNFGLGDKNGTFAFGNDAQLGGSFLTKAGPVIQAEMVDIAEFIAEYNIQHIDMMQVNIEGGEYYLLPYLINTGIIKTIRRLLIHWHTNPDLHSYGDTIRTKLYETHHMTRSWVFEAWERKPGE